MDPNRPSVPADQPRPYLVQFWLNYAKSHKHAHKGGSRAMLLGGCQNCWGGASSTARSAVEQVRPRQRKALAEGAAAGVWGRKNRSPRVLECT